MKRLTMDNLAIVHGVYYLVYYMVWYIYLNAKDMIGLINLTLQMNLCGHTQVLISDSFDTRLTSLDE